MSEKWKPACSDLECDLAGLKLDDIKDDTKIIDGKVQLRGLPPQPLTLPIYTTSVYKHTSDEFVDAVNNVRKSLLYLTGSCEHTFCTLLYAITMYFKPMYCTNNVV